VVINGHDHDYERFRPQTPDGDADTARGIREFIAGTSGKSQRPFAGKTFADSGSGDCR
jgi:alkaline phosphatase